MSATPGFKLGTTLESLTLLTVLGIRGDPLATYRPFSVADTLGDGSLEGNGFPVVTWHWDFLYAGESDILYNFISNNLSEKVFVCSKLNRLSSGLYTWQNWEGWMRWVEGEEEIQARKNLDLTITFTGLVVAE